MPKIIKYGNRLTWYVGRKICCINCDCLFQLTQEDKVEPFSDQRDGSGVKIDCPQCGRKTWINAPHSGWQGH